MPGRLGCGYHEAFITDKCDGVRLCDLVNADSIYYDRRLDDISEAEVSIPIQDAIDSPCCRCLADIEPWCHELVIHRDGEIVWKGVVQEVRYAADRVTIKAKDKLAWLTVRVPEAPIINTDQNVSLTTTASKIIQLGIDDDDSMCFNNCIIDLGDGLEGDFRVARIRAFTAFDGTVFDQLQSLAESGIDYTVVRGCLILGSDDIQVAPIAVLTDEHLLGSIEIVKDAAEIGNRFYSHFDEDDTVEGCNGILVDGQQVIPCPVVADATNRYCYGLIERVVSDAVIGIPNPVVAKSIAQQYATASSNPPRRIDFPAGTQLSPNTPWALNDMIPGQKVRVALTGYCLPVNTDFVLQKVVVNDKPEGESVSVELGALNALTGST